MTKKTTKTNSKESATTKPIVPDWIQTPVQNNMGNYNNLYGTTSPADTYAAPNALQQRAYGYNGNAGTGYTSQAANTLGQVSRYDAPQIGFGDNPTYSYSSQGGRLVGTPNPTISLPNAAQAQFTAAQTAANPSLSQAYAPAPITAQRVGDLGTRQFATAARPDLDPTALDYDVVSANAGGVSAKQAKDFLADYQPYANSALVNSTMQSFNDQAGRSRAAFEAQAAGSGAFGGSRSAIAQAELERNLGLSGAQLRAQMEDAALTRALGAATGDADRFLSGDIATANNSTQASIANAQLGTQANRDQAQWLMDRYGIDAGLNTFNAGQANSAYAQMFGENAQNLRQDAASLNDIAKLVYGTQAGMNQFNAGEANDLSSLIYNTQSGMNQFNAGQANNTSQFNTGQANNMGQFNAGLMADIFQGNADRDLQAQGLNLNAANSLGNLGLDINADARAGASTDLALGADQERLQMAEQLSPFVYQQLLNEGLDPALLSLFVGQQVDGTSSGTSKQSGGLLQSILSAAAQAGSAAMMASERRVKRDIAKQAEDSDGLGWYSFRYVWDDDSAPVRFGTMVDEVERIRPWALGPVVDGVRTVNYGAL